MYQHILITHTLVFLSAVAALLSFWLWPRTVSWSLVALSILLALIFRIMLPFGLAWLVLLGIFLAGYFKLISLDKGMSRTSVGIFIVLLSLGLMRHFLPGFIPWQVVVDSFLSIKSRLFPMALQYENACVAFLFLGFANLVCREKNGWKNIVKAWPLDSLIIIAIMLGLGLASGWIRFDVKFPALTPLWMARNLLLVSLPEECLFRGFIQRELSLHWQDKSYGKPLAVLIASVLFGLYHYWGGLLYIGLTTLAGICFGIVYQRRGYIESSILVHFSLNMVHFLFFTYPK